MSDIFLRYLSFTLLLNKNVRVHLTESTLDNITERAQDVSVSAMEVIFFIHRFFPPQVVFAGTECDLQKHLPLRFHL